MKLIEAMLSLKTFKRPHSLQAAQYFLAKTGPYKDLVSCDYFVIYSNVDTKNIEVNFSTSLDLYPEDILADDYLLIESL